MNKLLIAMLLFAAAPGALAQQGAANVAQAVPEAIEAPPDLPVCTLDPRDSNKLLVEPCRPAPPQGTRRSVPQVIQAMPAQAARPVYGLHPAPAPPPFNPTGPGPTVGPAAPLPVNSCDIGGCRDASGARHDGGAGNATLDANGRVCHRNGVWLQCF